MDHTLVFDQVTRRYGSNVAIGDVSTKFGPGMVSFILGANGAGKSTLLSLARGRAAASSGRISIGGRLVSPRRVAIRTKSYLLEERPLASPAFRWTADLLAAYGAAKPGVEDELMRRFDQLDITDAVASLRAGLSRGQEYKVRLAAMLTVRPPLWFLDEPYSSGLDTNGLAVMESEVKQHAASGGTILITSQWPQHAVELATHLLVLELGRVVIDQPMGEKLARSAFDGAPPRLTAILDAIDQVQ